MTVPPPNPELSRLQPLVGSWRSHGLTQDTALAGPGVEMYSEERFYWLEGGYYLVQTYKTKFGDEPVQQGINYWYFDDDSSTFNVIFFSNNGPFTEEGNRYRGTTDGDRLTMVGPARFELLLDSHGAVARLPDGSIPIEWWLLDDQGAYQPWMWSPLEPA